jgi:hypothetical protein
MNEREDNIKMNIKYIGSVSICGLVVRVPGYGSGGNGFNSRGYQIF